MKVAKCTHFLFGLPTIFDFLMGKKNSCSNTFILIYIFFLKHIPLAHYNLFLLLLLFHKNFHQLFLEAMIVKEKKNIFQFSIILCMGNFGNRANFRLPDFGGFTSFGVWRIQKTPNQHGVRVFVSQFEDLLVSMFVRQLVSLWKRYLLNKSL